VESALTAVAGALLFLAGALRWRAAVFCSLALAVFDGALRKWIFPESGHLIYFAKDVALLGAYAGFWAPRLLSQTRLVPRHPATGPLVAFMVIAGFQLFNPRLPNIWLGLFGIKAYLIYFPLLYMVPSLFPSMKGLERFWSVYLLLSVVPLSLGVVQFFAPADSIVNRYAWDQELAPSVATFGVLSSVRVTGTFSYISGYTAYLLVLVLITLALMAHQRRPWMRWGLQGVLGLAIVNLFMTGSRGPFLVLGGALLLEAVLSAAVRRPGMVRKALVVSPAIPITAFFVIGLFPEAWSAFVARVESNEDIGERIAGLVTEPLWALGEAGVSGFGIGSTHQATHFLMPAVWMDALPPPAEGEWERIILEVGPVGFALVLLVRVLVSWQLWRKWRLAGQENYRLFLTAALFFSLISFPGSLVFNQTASLFYWFFAGFGLLPSEVRRPERTPILHSLRRQETVAETR